MSYDRDDKSEKSPMYPYCSIWKHEDKRGVTYFAGNVGHGCRLLIFPNMKKREKHEPDYLIFIGENARRYDDDRKDDKRDDRPDKID